MLIGRHLQMTDVVSSCEAEYITLAAAVQEGMYLTQMLKDIGEVSGHVLIFEDNQVSPCPRTQSIDRDRNILMFDTISFAARRMQAR